MLRHAPLEKAVDGGRLTPEEGLAILEGHDLLSLAAAADTITRRLHPAPYRTYNVDRNINYTNICTYKCKFCGFSKGPLSLNLRGNPYLLEI